MNIYISSDWHGRLPKIPEAIKSSSIDLAILCGDLEPNFPDNWLWNDYFQRMCHKTKEAADQLLWIQNEFGEWVKKNEVKDVVYVPGNHTFCDPTSAIVNSVFEQPKTITIGGIKIGLLPGSMTLVGEWQLESTEEEMEARIKGLDRDIQILVSHVPPYQILDRAHNGDRIGCRALSTAIFGLSGVQPYFTHLTHSLYGHCHEAAGNVSHEIDGRTVTFCNTAKTYKAITI